MHRSRVRRQLAQAVVITACGALFLTAPLWRDVNVWLIGLGAVMVLIGPWAATVHYRDLKKLAERP